MKRFLLIFGAAVALLAATGSAQAVSLADLVNGSTLTANNLMFDNWSVDYNEVSDLSGFSSVDTAAVNVSALIDGGNNPGPGLSFSSNEFNVTGDGIYAYVDFMFSFRVTASSGLLIDDTSLNFGSYAYTASATDTGMFISETIGTAFGLSDLGTNEVEFSQLGTTHFSTLNDYAEFTSLSEIWVTKNILVWATETTEWASLAQFDQRFSQTPVPEPAMMLLFGTGLIGLGLFRGRKRNK